MTAYSTLLYEGVVATTATFTELFSVPSGRVYVVRDITGTTRYAGAMAVLFNTDSVPLWRWAYAAQYALVQWQGAQVFPAGHALYCQVTQADVVLRVSGYTLVA